jgi:hypothetical protein
MIDRKRWYLVKTTGSEARKVARINIECFFSMVGEALVDMNARAQRNGAGLPKRYAGIV